MAEQSAATGVLRRMLHTQDGSDGNAPDPAAQPATILAGLLPRVAQETLQLMLSVQRVEAFEAEADGLSDDMAEHALLALLNGPEGVSALAVLSPSVVSSLVAHRMTGQVPETLGPARAPSRVDAQLARPLLNAIIQKFATALPGEAGPFLRSFSYGGYVSDARLVRFALPPGKLQGLRANLSLGQGGCEGQLTLVLPPPPERAVQSAAKGGRDWTAQLATNVGQAHCVLQAVLARVPMTLSQVTDLQPGQDIVLPGGALDAVMLQVGGQEVVATGRLGKARGDRAVRLQAAATPVAQPIDGPGQDAPQPVIKQATP